MRPDRARRGRRRKLRSQRQKKTRWRSSPRNPAEVRRFSGSTHDLGGVAEHSARMLALDGALVGDGPAPLIRIPAYCRAAAGRLAALQLLRELTMETTVEAA